MATPPPTTDHPPRFRRVTLATADVAAERRWWSGRLGFPLLDGESDRFAVRVGNGELAFVAAAAGHPPHHHVALEVAPDLLVEAAAWLGRASRLVAADDEGGTVVDFANWVAHSVYAVSPGGHVIELIARHRRRWSPGDEGIFDVEAATAEATRPPAGPDLVRGISEVGVVAPDVPALVDRLADVGLHPWFGDPASGFCAVGDEAGLVICAREWRPWFPTDVAAAPGLVRIVRDDAPVDAPFLVGSACELVPADDPR